ncbi:hypothetical protein DPX16_18900 [Anabarilius grahami]|uniref:Uncharacterized protein n=1 Tax=Anabarilius grahami TaxID=495550 RepID=A0A3N0YLG3_ANAGA|nr:hypothetical protein DPX16_18900 [Anabarilius grahami]
MQMQLEHLYLFKEPRMREREEAEGGRSEELRENERERESDLTCRRSSSPLWPLSQKSTVTMKKDKQSSPQWKKLSPTAIGWKAKASHPFKPCRTVSALASRAFAADGQAASALHTMEVLQVFQAKLLHDMDEQLTWPCVLLNPPPQAIG